MPELMEEELDFPIHIKVKEIIGMEENLPLENKIKDSRIGVFESSKENYYDEADNTELINEIISFLKQFKK